MKDVAIRSGLRSLDDQDRDMQFELKAGNPEAGETGWRVRMIFP